MTVGFQGCLWECWSLVIEKPRERFHYFGVEVDCCASKDHKNPPFCVFFGVFLDEN